MTSRSLGGIFPHMQREVEGMICGRINTPAAAAADLRTKSLLDVLSDIF